MKSSTQGYTRPSNSVRDSSRIENAPALLAELRERGVFVARERKGGKFRVRVTGTQAALDSNTLDRLRANAAQVRDWLRAIEARSRADREWAHQRGLEVPTEAKPSEPTDPELEVWL